MRGEGAAAHVCNRFSCCNAQRTASQRPHALLLLRQVLLRWGIQNGCAVIPKSSQPERIAEFAPAQLLDGWQLSEADMAALAGLEDGHKYCWDASSIT